MHVGLKTEVFCTLKEKKEKNLPIRFEDEGKVFWKYKNPTVSQREEVEFYIQLGGKRKSLPEVWIKGEKPHIACISFSEKEIFFWKREKAT